MYDFNMSDAAARLTIHLFGALEVRLAQAPLSLNHQKARALLWSESSESDARHSLRSNLYRLRQSLRLAGNDGWRLEAGRWLRDCPDLQSEQLAATLDDLIGRRLVTQTEHE